MSWRRGKKKGELRDVRVALKKLALDPRFEAFVLQTGIDLADVLKKAEGYENLSSAKGSPWCCNRNSSGLLVFIETLGVFLQNVAA
ncbi:MAG: hypothetical protein U0822_03150 [Anaerolineae bacterium]